MVILISENDLISLGLDVLPVNASYKLDKSFSYLSCIAPLRRLNVPVVSSYSSLYSISNAENPGAAYKVEPFE